MPALPPPYFDLKCYANCVWPMGVDRCVMLLWWGPAVSKSGDWSYLAD